MEQFTENKVKFNKTLALNGLLNQLFVDLAGTVFRPSNIFGFFFLFCYCCDCIGKA